jgi:hypothetical protein
LPLLGLTAPEVETALKKGRQSFKETTELSSQKSGELIP